MGFDGLTTAALVRELQGALPGARAVRIHQPGPWEVTLGLRFPPQVERDDATLLFSVHPRHARAHLSHAARRNPPRPPAFVTLLRARIGSGRIEAVYQPGRDRTVVIDIATRDDLGNPALYTLVAELMGRNANLILLAPAPPAAGPAGKPAAGTGGLAGRRIVDVLRRSDPERAGPRRPLLPGQPYDPPPPAGKLDPLDLAPDALLARAAASDGQVPLWQAVLAHVDGTGPLAAREIVHRAGLGDARAEALDPDTARRLAAAAAGLWEETLASPGGYLLYDEAGRLADFAPFHPAHWTGRVRKTATLSAALDQFYTAREEEEREAALAARLRRALDTHRERAERKLAAQEAELAAAGDPDLLRKQGETLLAHLWQVPAGASAVDLPDLEDPEQTLLRVALDPALTPAENAQSYFRRYQRARRAREAIADQLARTRSALERLDRLRERLDRAASLPELEAVRQELAAAGYLAPDPAPGAGSPAANGAPVPEEAGAGTGPARGAVPGPLVFRSADGLEIWVGRSGRQNEALTLRLASPTDIWLHAQKIPGAHVILRLPPGTEPPEASLLEAAALAAYFSRARHSSSVPVDYTLCRHVRKPAGARPGMVLYDRQRTVTVTPDPERFPILREALAREGQSPARPDTGSA